MIRAYMVLVLIFLSACLMAQDLPSPVDSFNLTNSGTIKAVNIQEKTIQIGETLYGLVDGIKIYSKDNVLLNQLALAPGQFIQYSASPQPLEIYSLPRQVITIIHIMKGHQPSGLQS